MFTSPGAAFSQEVAPREEGIPVTDALVKAKCGGCHKSDDRGNMQRIAWERSTPEGWQIALKRMQLLNDVDLTPAETRHVIQYLSTHHGLAPEEAKGVMYDVERRVHDETGFSESMLRACGRCHNLARALSWRRSADDWKEFAITHALRYNVLVNEEAVGFLAKIAPLHTPEWSAWTAPKQVQSFAGRWLVTAHVLGRIAYFGEMQIEPAGPEGEFSTSATLQSVRNRSMIIRTGRGVAYGAYAWRGSSTGERAASFSPNDASNEAVEVMTVAPDQTSADGRWFWGQYQELGFDIKMRRVSPDATLLALDRPLLKAGSKANRVRLIGHNFPAQITKADLNFGPGCAVRRIVTHTSTEVIAEVDAAPNAPVGKRSVSFRGSVLPGAIAIYDRIDYISVTPDSAMASYGSQTRRPGYQQFEAVAYKSGPDGKWHTDDDLELGPIDVTWSTKVFYESEGGNSELVGTVSPTGLFVPSSMSPAGNFDVWVIANTNPEREGDRNPLVGKSYLVVTIPVYTFNGRRYVRDLNRWVDDGPARPVQ